MDDFQIDTSEFLEDFKNEAEDILLQLEEGLLSLERDPLNKDIINSLFRAAHTLKGTASFFNLERITELAHILEDILQQLRDDKISFSQELLSLFFEMLSALRDGLDGKEIDSGAFRKKVEEIISRGEEKKINAEKAPSEEALIPENSRKIKLFSIKVDVKKLDSLMDLVSELVIGRNRLLQVAREHESEKLEEVVSFLNRVVSDIREEVMSMRMVSIRHLFSRFPRVVKELALKLGKEVDLLIEGEDTEIDKNLVEGMYEPMVHILRNAVDHGIEPPEERKAMGKSRKGKITVRAYHMEGRVIIEVEDDGRGIDLEAVRRKLLEIGEFPSETVAKMSEKDLLKALFIPGFSTAKRITEVSGRGVGMDVVKDQVEKLGGTIEVFTVEGKGTRFTIKLPMTLAIVVDLLMEWGGRKFLIPLSSVEEVLRVRQEDVVMLSTGPAFFWRNLYVPLLSFEDLLGVSGEREERDFYLVVLLRSEGKRVGLKVESLLGKREIVVKRLGDYLGRVPGIEGAAILGDGSIAFILDVPYIFNWYWKEEVKHVAAS